MQVLIKPDYVIGSKVFFIENRIPHTGYVKEIYDSYVEVEDVSGLDLVWDRKYSHRHRSGDIMDDVIWKVKEENLYKTGKVYLPKFPTFEQREYISQIIHNCASDKMIDKTNYENFFKYYTGIRQLLSSKINRVIDPFGDDIMKSGSYLVFGDSLQFVTIDPLSVPSLPIGYKSVFKIKRIKVTAKSSDITVIEKFSSDEEFNSLNIVPSAVFVPLWRDKYRFPNTDKNWNELMAFVTCVYKSKYPDVRNMENRIIDANILNEDSITGVYEMNDKVLLTFFQNWLPQTMKEAKLMGENVSFSNLDILPGIIQVGDALKINFKYFDRVY